MGCQANSPHLAQNSSRAIAVTAYQDSFRIFALHSLEEIHRQIAQGRPLNPIKEERTFSVRGGFIAHAEFLYPSRSDRDQVLLVLFFIESVLGPSCLTILCPRAC